MRVLQEHWDLLLVMCERYPELITNKFNGSEGKGDALWKTVTQQLNSLGFGEKSTENWRKALIDWKSKTKAKAAKLNKEIKGTGGGPSQCTPLSDLENRLLSLMGTTAVEGDDVQEMGFGLVKVKQSSKKKLGRLVLPQVEHKDHLEPTTSSSFHRSVSLIGLPLDDHDSSQLSCSASVKRKLEFRPERRVRPRQEDKLSNKLTNLSEETLLTLKNIDKSIESMTESLKVIASVVKNSVQ